MYYHVKSTLPQLEAGDESGKKIKTEIVVNVDLFSQAELQGFEYAKEEYGTENVDVNAISRTKIMEIVRTGVAESEPTKWFRVTVAQTFLDENTGKEKDLKYIILVEAYDSSDADKRTTKHLSQLLSDSRIIKIEETRIEEVIE